jgi:hypothetical protein
MKERALKQKLAGVCSLRNQSFVVVYLCFEPSKREKKSINLRSAFCYVNGRNSCGLMSHGRYVIVLQCQHPPCQQSPVQKASVARVRLTSTRYRMLDRCYFGTKAEISTVRPTPYQRLPPDATKAIAVLHAIIQNVVRCKYDVVIIRTRSPLAMSPNFSTSRRALSLLRQKPVSFHKQRSF